MTMLADGGALADAGLVVNALIAVGTIGAATVALRLGLAAQHASASQVRETRLKLIRQIVAVYHAERPRTVASVEIINASPEVINDILVTLTTAHPDEETSGRVWEWGDESLRSFPMVHYLLPGQAHPLRVRSGPIGYPKIRRSASL